MTPTHFVYAAEDGDNLSFDYTELGPDGVSRLVVIFDRDPPRAHWYFASTADSYHGVFTVDVMERFELHAIALTSEDQAHIALFVGTDPGLASLIADSGLVLPVAVPTA